MEWLYLCSMRMYVALTILFLSTFFSRADSFVRFEEKGKIGLKDEAGKILIPASFEGLGWSDGNFSVIGEVTGYQLKGKWGIINLQKQFITPAEFETLTYPGGDRVIVSHKINPFTLKYGCLDLKGKITIPFYYDGLSIQGMRATVFIKNGSVLQYGLIDLNGKGVIPLLYQKIHPIGTLRYGVESISNKTALFSEGGQQLTDFVIDSLSVFQHGLAIIYQNLGEGIIDRTGEIKIKPIYRKVAINDDGSVAVRDFDSWKILDEKNKELKQIQGDQLSKLSDGHYRISLAGKVGLIDKELKPVLPITLDFIGESNYGNRVIGLKGKYGIIRKHSSMMMELSFDSLLLDRNFIRARGVLNGKTSWMLYDTFAVQKSVSSYDVLESYNGKFFGAKKRGYWGAVNRYGEEFINCVFDSLLEFKDNLLAVKFRGQYGIINLEEKWLLPPQPNPVSLINEDCFFEYASDNTFLKKFDQEIVYFTTNPIEVEGDHLIESLLDGLKKKISFEGVEIQTIEEAPVTSFTTISTLSEGFRAIKKDGKYGFVDIRGRLRIANRYDNVSDFHEGLAPIKLIGKWGFVNIDDHIVINPNYESVEAFVNHISIVSRNAKTGLIDNQGKVLLPLRYDLIRRLPDQTFALELSSLHGLADARGNVLIEPRFESLVNLQNGFVIVGRDGKYGLLTLEGLSIIPMVYDQLEYDPLNHHYLVLKKSEWKSMKW